MRISKGNVLLSVSLDELAN